MRCDRFLVACVRIGLHHATYRWVAGIKSTPKRTRTHQKFIEGEHDRTSLLIWELLRPTIHLGTYWNLVNDLAEFCVAQATKLSMHLIPYRPGKYMLAWTSTIK